MRCIANAIGIVALVVSVSSLGCAVEDPDALDRKTEEKAKEKESAIYGGSSDSGDDAVVFLYSNQGFACTGTIISKNGNTGYVLTAAHCDGIDYVIQADNLAACLNNDQCENFWQVDDQVVHPSFDENQIDNGYDFSLIRFTGANTAPAAVPAASSPDGVAVNSQVNLVGYGLTESGDADFRMNVVMPVDTLYSNFLGFDQSGGTGTCQGDSGGPAILNGKVVGVTSFGGQSCTGPGAYGYSGRVSFVYNDFIAPYIGAPVMETCETCANAAQGPGGQCASQVDGCFNNAECAALVECTNNCSTQACYDGCYDQHPNGAAGLDALIACICDSCSVCDCGSSSSVTTVTTGGPTVATTGAGGASSAGGAPATTNGGAPSNGGQSSEGGGDAVEDGGSDEGCGCAVAGREDASQSPWLGALAIAFGVGAASRRRRRA